VHGEIYGTTQCMVNFTVHSDTVWVKPEEEKEREREDTWRNFSRGVCIETGHTYFQKSVFSLVASVCVHCMRVILCCFMWNSPLTSSYWQTYAYSGLVSILWHTQTCMLVLGQGDMCCMHVCMLFVWCIWHTSCEYADTYIHTYMHTAHTKQRSRQE